MECNYKWFEPNQSEVKYNPLVRKGLMLGVGTKKIYKDAIAARATAMRPRRRLMTIIFFYAMLGNKNVQ